MIDLLDGASAGRKEIALKTAEERSAVARAGKVTGRLLQKLVRSVRPGLTTAELEERAQRFAAALRSHMRIEGPPHFPALIAVSVNDTAVHGIPGGYVLREGDILTVDAALKVDGWYADCAVTVGVGALAPRTQKLIYAARESTRQGIAAARAGGRMGDIGEAISRTAKRYGAEVIEMFVGHGIGAELHEEPAVFPVGAAGTGQPLVPGMIFTVEPVLTFGSGSAVQENGDDVRSRWPYRTADGAPTALFEHTVALLSERTLILTAEAEPS
jgi:methionyl aminopeptidase